MFQKMMGGILVVLGLCLFAFGSYVSNEAAQGEVKIAQAEENVQEGRRPILGPVRRNVRNEQMAAAQNRIGTEKENIGKSQVTGNWLRGSGIVLFAVGLGTLIYSLSRKKRG